MSICNVEYVLWYTPFAAKNNIDLYVPEVEQIWYKV